MENLRRILTAIFFEVILLQSSRFGEALRLTQENLDKKNFYAYNPAFDKPAQNVKTGCNTCRSGNCDISCCN